MERQDRKERNQLGLLLWPEDEMVTAISDIGEKETDLEYNLQG